MRERILLASVVCGLTFGIATFTSVRPSAEEPVSFSKDVKPIFESSCWACSTFMPTTPGTPITCGPPGWVQWMVGWVPEM